MNKRLTQFLATARLCSLSPVEHAQARAEIVAHMATTKEAPSLLQKSAGSLRLTDDEKAVCRSRLLHFMRTHPPEERSSFLFSRLLRRFAPASVASAVVMTLAGGGIAFAAEGSLPGDLLYPVKIHVTEPLRATLSVSPVARAQWNVRQIERRLLEATAITERPNQNERQAVLHSQMEQDIGNLQEHLNALPPEDQRMIRRDLLSELTEHQKSLRHIQDSAGIPHTLRVLAEDAADERQEPTPNREDERSSSSEEEKPDRSERKREDTEQRRELIVVPAPVREKEDREEASSEFSRASTSASSSEKRKEESEIPPKKENKEKEDRREKREEREDTVESLLDLLREVSPPASSSEASSVPEEQALSSSSSSRAQSSKSREEKEEREQESDR